MSKKLLFKSQIYSYYSDGTASEDKGFTYVWKVENGFTYVWKVENGRVMWRSEEWHDGAWDEDDPPEQLAYQGYLLQLITSGGGTDEQETVI